jgi:hypothetical protein
MSLGLLSLVLLTAPTPTHPALHAARAGLPAGGAAGFFDAPLLTAANPPGPTAPRPARCSQPRPRAYLEDDFERVTRDLEAAAGSQAELRGNRLFAPSEGFSHDAAAPVRPTGVPLIYALCTLLI